MLPEVRYESISRDDAEEFCSAVEAVLTELSFPELKKLYLFTNKTVDRIKREPCIVISFDGDWQPFLGHTRGLNNSSKPPRLAITSDRRVLDIARTSLKRFAGPSRPGGRVFIHHKCFLHDRGALGTWQWDAGDPVERLRRFYDSVEMARLDEERRAASEATREAKRKEWDGDPAAAERLLAAKQHFQRIGEEHLFNDVCRAYELGRQIVIDQARRASVCACVRARREDQMGNSAFAELYRSSARQHLQDIGQEDLFEGIWHRASTLRVLEECHAKPADKWEQHFESMCDDLFKAIF
jgi:hypothetical protein